MGLFIIYRIFRHQFAVLRHCYAGNETGTVQPQYFHLYTPFCTCAYIPLSPVLKSVSENAFPPAAAVNRVP